MDKGFGTKNDSTTDAKVDRVEKLPLNNGMPRWLVRSGGPLALHGNNNSSPEWEEGILSELEYIVCNANSVPIDRIKLLEKIFNEAKPSTLRLLHMARRAIDCSGILPRELAGHLCAKKFDSTEFRELDRNQKVRYLNIMEHPFFCYDRPIALHGFTTFREVVSGEIQKKIHVCVTTSYPLRALKRMQGIFPMKNNKVTIGGHREVVVYFVEDATDVWELEKPAPFQCRIAGGRLLTSLACSYAWETKRVYTDTDILLILRLGFDVISHDKILYSKVINRTHFALSKHGEVGLVDELLALQKAAMQTGSLNLSS
jgi:hypothetical protein